MSLLCVTSPVIAPAFFHTLSALSASPCFSSPLSQALGSTVKNKCFVLDPVASDLISWCTAFITVVLFCSDKHGLEMKSFCFFFFSAFMSK